MGGLVLVECGEVEAHPGAAEIGGFAGGAGFDEHPGHLGIGAAYDGMAVVLGAGIGMTEAGEHLAADLPRVELSGAGQDGAGTFGAERVDLRAGHAAHRDVGQGRITANLEGFTPDFACRVDDATAVRIVFDLLEHEGLCLGGSSGINVAGAMAMAREMGPGHTIVTILCDYGTRYQSKLFNPDFLRSRDLPVPSWMEGGRAVPEAYE